MKSEKLRFKIKKIFKFWSIAYIIIVWFVFSSPYFLKGLVPFPSTYQVNHFPPWSHYQKFWGPVKNDAMPDVIDQIYPWKHFTIETWKKGQIPYWNPNNFAGNPHLANFQSAVFSPFNLLFFLFHFIDAWSLLVLLQPLLAGLCMYLFVREIGGSRVGSLISSISFMFCGFMVVWMAYGTLSMSVAFLPLILFAIEKNFKKLHIGSLLLLSLSLAASLFSGHFQISLYVFLFLIVYFLFKVFTTKNKKATVLVLLFILFGIIISSLQIIPSIQFYQHSVRSGIFIKQGNGIPFHYLVTIFAPDFFGNPVTRNNWFGFYAEWASFIGIIPFFLAFVSLFKKEKSFVLFFFIIGFAALFLAIGSPLQTVLGNLKIPVLSTSIPSRIIVLFSFSLAILAGYGFDILDEMIKRNHWKKLFPIFLALGGVLVLAWILTHFFSGFSKENIALAERNLILPSGLFLSFSLIVISASIWNKKHYSLFLLILILLFSTVDSFRFAKKWMPFDPRNLVFPQVPVISALQKNLGFGRVFGNLGAQVASYYDIQTIEGYDPLYIQRFGEFLRSSGNGDFVQAERSVAKLDRNGKYTERVLDLLGVTVIFHPIADTNTTWAFPVWKNPKKYSVVYQDNLFQLFRNNTALNRVQLFDNYEIIKEKNDIIKRFYSDDFNFRKTLILEERLEVQNVLNSKENPGSAQISLYIPNKIIVRVSSDHQALLFLSDNYYPLWKAKVNGLLTKIYRADYSFRAVMVPAGNSIVEFFI